jgi:hypothetical protein
MADRRAGRFRSEGLEPLAHLWDLIGAVVEDLQDTMGAGKPHAEFCRELGFPID